MATAAVAVATAVVVADAAVAATEQVLLISEDGNGTINTHGTRSKFSTRLCDC
jgi:hypothetical protein